MRTRAPSTGAPPALLVTVPSIVPTPASAAVTAAKAFTRPWPYVLSMHAVPRSSAVCWRICLIASTVRLGLAWRISATVPAMCGAAIDVPFQSPSQSPPGIAEKIATPGAEISGLVYVPTYGAKFHVTGPRLENDAITSALLVAPTPYALGTLPGLPVVLALGPLLPIEKLGNTPASTMLSVGAIICVNVAVAPSDMLTTSAPSSVFGLLSGSMIHSMPPATCVKLPLPPGMTRPCMSFAPGATPMAQPLALPPIIVPEVCVPCWSESWGTEFGRMFPLASNSAHPPGYFGSAGLVVYILPAMSG